MTDTKQPTKPAPISHGPFCLTLKKEIIFGGETVPRGTRCNWFTGDVYANMVFERHGRAVWLSEARADRLFLATCGDFVEGHRWGN